VFTKNRERKALSAFFKNPLFCDDKTFTDEFENYLIKYNINYSAILEPFELGFSDQETLEKYQAFREKICSFLDKFNVRALLERLDVKNRLIVLGERLIKLGERVEAEVNAQVYDAVISVLDQMQMLLSGVELGVHEFKKVFESGISALELSIIPQYGDAVFIGGYKEVALYKAGYLFALGLTSGVPIVSEDVALLSDGDINKLSEIKILVEPKIRVVNHRTVENTGMAIASFSRALIMSFPLLSVDGKKTMRSEILRYAERLFTVRNYKYNDDFLTPEQGLNSFARLCGDFAEGRINDLALATAYYNALEGDVFVRKVLENANKEIKVRLDGENRSVIDGVTSPTTIEDYYTCPYMAFARRALKLSKREEGVVNALSVGTLMHEIFNCYAERVGEVLDKESSDRLVDEIVADLIKKSDYARYIKDAENDFTLNKVILEAKKFCFGIFNQYQNSDFKFYKAEQSFEIPLKSGINLRGKIDRIDTYKGYCRIIDYKTGKPDGSEKSLFAGVKLQLYLYAISQKDFQTAGVYYLPVSDEYIANGKDGVGVAVGKTLQDQTLILSQDKCLNNGATSDFIPVTITDGVIKNATNAQVLEGLKEYALKMCEQGATRMQDGVIVSSPYGDACEYCEFKGMCEGEFSAKRKLKSVDETIINQACEGGNDNA
jgi:ATP-dependent helicase/nuclease subunit B